MKGGDFWSRRKAQVEAEQLREAAQIEAERASKTEAAQAERSDEDLLQEAGLPDPDQLSDPQQVQEFLRSNLPQRLKTRALRRLWRLNPILANVDGLVDYGEDYTDAATVVEGLQTVYQVGKGMLARFEELTENDMGAEEPAAQEAREETTPAAESQHAAPDQSELVQDDQTQLPPDPQGDPDEIAALPRARRMRFSYTAPSTQIPKETHL